jgi:acyl-CoA synthetase (AMP-forming)/AMP-acid ligase II
MEISLGEAITMTARNKPDAPSFAFFYDTRYAELLAGLQRLATYKVPAEFRFADALPVNASGKILKRELRTRD